MSRETREQVPEYKPEGWRDGNDSLAGGELAAFYCSHADPDVRDRSLVLELLGRINYRILSGNRVYVEVDGVVYKTLYGAYWRSVFTGIEHYLLKCEEIKGSTWATESVTPDLIDLPIAYSNRCWTASGHSLSFVLGRDGC